MINIAILDTETTGLSNHPKYGHPQVIELGIIHKFKNTKDILNYSKNISLFDHFVQRYYPSMDISVEATAIHGIYLKDLIGKPKSEDLVLPKMDYMIGHNIQYDHRCLGKPDIKTICTMKLMRKLYKNGYIKDVPMVNDKPTFALDNLISFYYADSAELTSQHNALSDCIKVIKLLKYIFTTLNDVPEIETLSILAN